MAAFERKKGLDVLLEAFALCLKDEPRLRLKMIGQKAEDFSALLGQVTRLDLADRVQLLTDIPNDQVLEEMRQADVFVLPSRREPFGLVLLEAGYVGTPIVASNVDGIPEVVPSANFGLLVPPDNPPALSAAILNVIRDPASASCRSINMRQRVLKQFTWDAAAEQYTAALQDLGPT